MFGFGKKKILAKEFGESAIRMAGDVIEGDYIRGCVGLLDPDYNFAEGDYLRFLDDGIAEERVQSGRITFYHATLQASCFNLNIPEIKEVVSGASEIMTYRNNPSYNFDVLFNTLERLYRGNTDESINGFDSLMHHMPTEINAVAAANAQHLLIECLPFSLNDEDSYSKFVIFYTSCKMAISTMERAVLNLNKKFLIDLI